MLKLNPTGWLARWYYRWEWCGGQRPATITLCHFFWVTVLRAPLRIAWHSLTTTPPTWSLPPLFLTAIGVFGGCLTSLFWIAPIATLIGGSISGTFIGILYLLECRSRRRYRTGPQKLAEWRVVLASYLAAKKRRICPIIELERRGD